MSFFGSLVLVMSTAAVSSPVAATSDNDNDAAGSRVVTLTYDCFSPWIYYKNLPNGTMLHGYGVVNMLEMRERYEMFFLEDLKGEGKKTDRPAGDVRIRVDLLKNRFNSYSLNCHISNLRDKDYLFKNLKLRPLCSLFTLPKSL